MNLFAKQKQSHRCKKTNLSLPVEESGEWAEMGGQDRHTHSTTYKIYN